MPGVRRPADPWWAFDKASTYASGTDVCSTPSTLGLGTPASKSASRWLLSEAERRTATIQFNINGLMRGRRRIGRVLHAAVRRGGAVPKTSGSLRHEPYVGGDEYRVPLNMAEPGQNPMEGDEDGKA